MDNSNIMNSIRKKMHQIGRVAQDELQTYYGYHFLRDQDGPEGRAAWFGFVDTSTWLREYKHGHPSELVIAYRQYGQYRLDGVHFNGRFVKVDADPNICGRPNVQDQIAWIANFDEKWDRKVWIETFEQVAELNELRSRPKPAPIKPPPPASSQKENQYNLNEDKVKKVIEAIAGLRGDDNVPVKDVIEFIKSDADKMGVSLSSNFESEIRQIIKNIMKNN